MCAVALKIEPVVDECKPSRHRQQNEVCFERLARTRAGGPPVTLWVHGGVEKKKIEYLVVATNYLRFCLRNFFASGLAKAYRTGHWLSRKSCDWFRLKTGVRGKLEKWDKANYRNSVIGNDLSKIYWRWLQMNFQWISVNLRTLVNLGITTMDSNLVQGLLLAAGVLLVVDAKEGVASINDCEPSI